jgi:hypothetical protein
MADEKSFADGVHKQTTINDSHRAHQTPGQRF